MEIKTIKISVLVSMSSELNVAMNVIFSQFPYNKK